MSFINSLEILSNLSSEEKEQLSLFSQEKILRAWENLFKEWEEWIAMYFLKSWIIDIFKKVDFEDVLLWEVESEEVLWEMALFWESKKRMATAVAQSDCELITILSFSIKDLTKKYPDLLEKIKSIIEKRTISNKKLVKDIK